MRDAGALLPTVLYHLQEGPMIAMQYGKAAGVRIGCSTTRPFLRQDGQYTKLLSQQDFIADTS